MLDYEPTAIGNNLPAFKTFASALNKIGKPVIIYANPTYWSTLSINQLKSFATSFTSNPSNALKPFKPGKVNQTTRESYSTNGLSKVCQLQSNSTQLPNASPRENLRLNLRFL